MNLGCVHRKLLIRSNPPGALVYVDEFEVGKTPITVDYEYYATRNIRLVKDGHETIVDTVSVPPPWYEYPGIDFFSENIVPARITDARVLEYKLPPKIIVPSDQLLSRAESLRVNARSTGLISPPPAAFGTLSEPLPEALSPGPRLSPANELPNPNF